MKLAFNENELPVKQLEQLGLFKEGNFLLTEGDRHGLLAGRRTELIRLSNISDGNVVVAELDAKLSLLRGEDGKVELRAHPIYHQVPKHPLLTELEMQQLQDGRLSNVRKSFPGAEGREQNWVIEFDRDTREYVSYNPEAVLVPDRIGQHLLSEEEKKKFRNGEVLALDGDQVQHRASDPKGVWSDNKQLILSVLLDGGISYLLLRGLRNLSGDYYAAAPEVKTAYVPMPTAKESLIGQRTREEVAHLQRDMPGAGIHLGQQESHVPKR